MVSAFWHGFYYAYYIAFFFSAIYCEIAKDIYKARSLFHFIPGPLRMLIANILTFVGCNYQFVVINALTGANLLVFFNATHWFMIILPPVALALVKGLGLSKIARKIEQK